MSGGAFVLENDKGIIRGASVWNKLSGITVWAIAFAFVEAAVVVYLRKLFHPQGFAFSLEAQPFGLILGVEVAREAATMVMLASCAWLADRRMWVRFGLLMVAFGVWDIFYYVWLWVILGWPPSPATLDILFLIPIAWIGPVWAPCLVSVGLIGAGAAVALRVDRGNEFALGSWGWAAELLAAFLIITSFIWLGPEAMRGEMPGAFPWPIFAAGMALGLGGFTWAWRRSGIS